MKLYNTKSNSLEEFTPLIAGQVSMYVCGPTVYNHIHIGNARPIVVFDVLRRVLEAQGYQVKQVSNFTDVDDRIINKALEERVDETVISSRYIQAYLDVRSQLNTRTLAAMPQVTKTMEAIIAYIADLITEGYAYVVDGNVYFRVDADKEYGSLSHQNLEQLRVGARVEENEEKENPLDFALWKHTSVGITWDSPWGKGRPGWHTECVVMINQEFGGQMIDIHGGGQDLRFPHHENECAQCRALKHRELARYWVHNAMLNFDGEKMSKSLGNVMWAKDVVAELGSNVARWLLLSAHYRMALNFNSEALAQAQTEVHKIEVPMRQAYVDLQRQKLPIGTAYNEVIWTQFLAALEDDLNTPNANEAIFEAAKQLNQALRRRPFDGEAISRELVTLEKMMDVYGLRIDPIILSDEQRALFIAWDDAKAMKDYSQADILREQLSAQGLL